MKSPIITGRVPRPAGKRPAPAPAAAPVPAAAVADAAATPAAAPRRQRSWDAEATRHWNEGRQQAAVQQLEQRLQQQSDPERLSLIQQLSYYLFRLDRYDQAARWMAEAVRLDPGNAELWSNLAACQARARQWREVIASSEECLRIDPQNTGALDGLCAAASRLGDHQRAAEAGTRVLDIKNARARPRRPEWALPSENPLPFARRQGKRHVIAFSMWGQSPRYLRGALRNALLVPEVYPGWIMRLYHDDSVPADFLAVARELGVELRPMPSSTGLLERLSWRFHVASDPEVGYFLVRDIDSVVNAREVVAVNEWMYSGRWFHVMRDWWTHTDLVLAGMWGGVAGVLPDLPAMLMEYRSGKLETPNVDQWFLGDVLWSYLRESCLVHDRVFRPAGAQPFPGPMPTGSYHVGQDEYSARRASQLRWLGPWMNRCPSLADPAPAPKASQD